MDIVASQRRVLKTLVDEGKNAYDIMRCGMGNNGTQAADIFVPNAKIVSITQYLAYCGESHL